MYDQTSEYLPGEKEKGGQARDRNSVIEQG
jgi:hypothetical protein